MLYRVFKQVENQKYLRYKIIDSILELLLIEIP